MKKKGILLASILFVSALSFAIFTGCDKDTNSYLDVTVYDAAGINVQPGVLVKLSTGSGTIKDSGLTDSKGVYHATMYAPGVFDVEAFKEIIDTNENKQGRYLYVRGASSVRLKESETVEASVKLGTTPMPAIKWKRY